MSLLPVTVPKSAVQALTHLLIPPETADGKRVELMITINDRNLNAREFGAYLSLADRVYGRMNESGLSSYARKAPEQLVFYEVRQGSLQLVATQSVSRPTDATPVAVLWLCLKHLPAWTKPSSGSAKSRARSSHDWLYRNGALDEKMDQEARKHLREELRQNTSLQGLDNRKVGQLATLLGELYTAERQHLPACARFTHKSVKEVTLAVRSQMPLPEQRYPLRGTPFHYQDPTLPVAQDDWDAAR